MGSTQRKNLLRLFASPPQSSSQMLLLRRMGARGGLPFVLDIVTGRIPPEGPLAATLVLGLGGDNG